MHQKPVVAITAYRLPILLYEKDLIALARAREILEKHIVFSGLKVLTRACGINELKLKAGFKHIYGVSPRAYHIDCKMRLAKNYLMAGFDVEEVARRLGYRHKSSFVKAWREWNIEDRATLVNALL